jgi:hypothetical protein
MDNSGWVPKPQSTEVRELRRTNWQLDVEVHVERHGRHALESLLDRAQTLLKQAERRDASLREVAAAGRLWAEVTVQQLGEVHASIITSCRSEVRKLKAELKAAGIEHANELESALDLAEQDATVRVRATVSELRLYQKRIYSACTLPHVPRPPTPAPTRPRPPPRAHTRPHPPTPAHTRPHLPTPAHTCPHPPTPAHTRPHPPTPSHTRPHPPTPSHTRPHPPTPAHTRPHPPTPAPTRPHPPPPAHIRPHPPPRRFGRRRTPSQRKT